MFLSLYVTTIEYIWSDNNWNNMFDTNEFYFDLLKIE